MSQVRASHLLVKHQGSRRPASWKDESGAVITKRTKEQVRSHCPLVFSQHSNAIVTVHKLFFFLSSSPSPPQAIATLLGFHAQIVAGADFAALVRILPRFLFSSFDHFAPVRVDLPIFTFVYFAWISRALGRRARRATAARLRMAATSACLVAE